MSPHPYPVPVGGECHAARRRGARTPAPVPVELRIRAFPAIPPQGVDEGERFPERVLLAEIAVGRDGRAISGVYLGDGPDLDEVAGRFLGPAAPEGLEPPGPGPLRNLDGFLDRLIWRLLHESRFGGVMWDPAAFFASLAYAFRKRGTWAVLWTDLNPEGQRWVNYYRPPMVFDAQSDGRVLVHFGPRKDPDPRDFDVAGQQYRGRFAGLQDVVSSLAGERVEDLSIACHLFGINPPPRGAATVEKLPERIVALRELCRAVRNEAESWP